METFFCRLHEFHNPPVLAPVSTPAVLPPRYAINFVPATTVSVPASAPVSDSASVSASASAFASASVSASVTAPPGASHISSTDYSAASSVNSSTDYSVVSSVNFVLPTCIETK